MATGIHWLIHRITVYPLVFIYPNPKMIENSMHMNISGVVLLQLCTPRRVQLYFWFWFNKNLSRLAPITEGNLCRSNMMNMTRNAISVSNAAASNSSLHQNYRSFPTALYHLIAIYPCVSYQQQYIKLTVTFHWKSHISTCHNHSGHSFEEYCRTLCLDVFNVG